MGERTDQALKMGCEEVVIGHLGTNLKKVVWRHVISFLPYITQSKAFLAKLICQNLCDTRTEFEKIHAQTRKNNV